MHMLRMPWALAAFQLVALTIVSPSNTLLAANASHLGDSSVLKMRAHASMVKRRDSGPDGAYSPTQPQKRDAATSPGSTTMATAATTATSATSVTTATTATSIQDGTSTTTATTKFARLINFDKHLQNKKKQQNWARFILAKSMSWPRADNNDTSPLVVITNEKCLERGPPATEAVQAAAAFNQYKLMTKSLHKDAGFARNCQSFFLHEVDEEKRPWDAYQNGTKSYPVAVTSSNISFADPVGWKMCAEGTGNDKKPTVTWEGKLDVNATASHLVAQCKRWWTEHERYSASPQFYGLDCLLKFRDDTSICMKAHNDPKDANKGQDILYEECSRNEPDMIWHIQSTAHEWPNYWIDDAPKLHTPADDAVDGRFYGKSPSGIFQCGKKCRADDPLR